MNHTFRSRFLLLLGFSLAIAPLRAETSETVQQPLWEIHLNLAEGYQSSVGQWIMKQVVEKNPEAEQKMEDFVQALGFDPRSDLKHVVILGHSFEEAEVTAYANLGNTTGNLEGWMLAAPGYRSEQLDDNTLLHSFVIEEKNQRIWCALPYSKSDGSYRLVASFDQNEALSMAREILDRGQLEGKEPLDEQAILSVLVHDLATAPLKLNADDPGAAVVETIHSFVLSLKALENRLVANLDITATSPVKARQLSQLLVGLKAMTQLLPQEELDEDAKKAVAMLNGLIVEHTEGETGVHATLAADVEQVTQLLEKKM